MTKRAKCVLIIAPAISINYFIVNCHRLSRSFGGWWPAASCDTDTDHDTLILLSSNSSQNLFFSATDNRCFKSKRRRPADTSLAHPP